MPLLNIGKKKQEAQPAQQQEVPDELPDLPQGAENAPEQALGDAGEVPDELPPAEAVGAEAGADLAPDELPPVEDAGAAVEGSEAGVHAEDRRLYFSNLLQKLQEEGLKSTKLTAPSANLLSDMKKHWKQQKKFEEIDAMNRQVAESIAPLQKLEQEWVVLQGEIERKKELLHAKEVEIRDLAEELKRNASKAEKMGSQKK